MKGLNTIGHRFSESSDKKQTCCCLCPRGRRRYPIQQLLSASADTKVKMYTTLPGKSGWGCSPSNKQWTKCLHPGKRWCRNTGSSENKGRSVSIYWAFTEHVPFSTWPGLLSLSATATTLELCLQKSVLSCSCEGYEKCLLPDIII